MKHDTKIKWLLALPIVLLLMASCSSVRKSQQRKIGSSDSVSVKKNITTDSSATTAVSVSSKKEKEGTQIVIEFEPDDFDSSLVRVTDRPLTEKDYLPDSSGKKKSIIIEVPAGGKGMRVDLGGNTPKSIRIHQQSDKEKNDSVAAAHTHISKKENSDSTHVKEESNEISSSKSKSKFLPFIGAAAGVALVWWLIAWLRRRKK